MNQLGGQDELVFDGASFGLHADRSLAFQLPAFTEQVTTVRWRRTGNAWRCIDGPTAAPWNDGDREDYAACVLGLRDYVNKNRFKGVVLGLSGGIDSALVAAMSVDALGPERVRCVMLPYRFTAQESLDDAAAVADALRVQYDVSTDRAGGARARRGARADVSRACRAMSPKKICRRACGAPS